MFQCNQCGECCRHLEKSDIYRELDRGDGVCVFLKGNLCSIYESRPLLCRIDECYEKYFKLECSVEEYYDLNYKACKELQEKAKGE